MSSPVSLWIEVPVGLLLVASGLFTLSAAIGLVRFKTFMQRMHPSALAFSLSAWCVALASMLYFSAYDGHLSLQAWLIIIFLSLTAPITTIFLARTELFRRRNHPAQAHSVPAPLSHTVPPRSGDSPRPPD